MPSRSIDSHPARWLVAVAVLIGALGLLLPLAVSALRDLVSLGT
ncbi:MAG: hypothetical protein WD011_02330 [Nitriliruptoraceae bacterium]